MVTQINTHDAVFRAIADPTRRHILELLGQADLRAGDIADAFPNISRPAVSKHLRVLREAGLIEEGDRDDGRERRYQLNVEALHTVQEWLQAFEQLWTQRLHTLKDLIEKGDD